MLTGSGKCPVDPCCMGSILIEMQRTESRPTGARLFSLVVMGILGSVPMPAQTPTPPTTGQDAAKKLFSQTCVACHSLNGVMIGPSLLEIAFLYKGNPDGIVAWAIKPGRKRNQMIPMPPMAHIPKPKLKAIADYILAVTKGKKIGLDGVTKKKLSPPTGRIQRILMPNSGPASIAVQLSDHMAYCWDAGTCRLRYVWTGGFISHTWGSGFLGHQDGNDRRYSFEKAVLQGLPFYTSGGMFPLRFGGGGPTPTRMPFAKPRYLGYRLDKHKRPHFLYKIGGVTVTEFTSTLPGDKGIVRQFKIPGNHHPLRFILTPQAGVTWTSDKGEWKGAELSLTADEARKFSISILKTVTGAKK